MSHKCNREVLLEDLLNILNIYLSVLISYINLLVIFTTFLCCWKFEGPWRNQHVNKHCASPGCSHKSVCFEMKINHPINLLQHMQPIVRGPTNITTTEENNLED